MSTVVRIPITNIYADGDYTGVILVGRAKKPMNVLLDTGSSAWLSTERSTHRTSRTATSPPISRRPIPTATAAALPAR